MTLSSGLINLLEQFTELRELFHFLGYQLVVRGCNSGTVRWTRWARSREGTQRLPALGAPLSQHPHVSVHHPRSSLKPSSWILMEGSLHRND